MDLFREKHTPQLECEPSQRVRVAPGYCVVSFYVLSCFSCVWLFVTQWTEACQALPPRSFFFFFFSFLFELYNISSVQSLSCVWLFTTPWTAARQASLSITNSWNLLKLMSIESVMPSSHLILCRSCFLLPSIFSSIRVFSNELVLRIRWPSFYRDG